MKIIVASYYPPFYPGVDYTLLNHCRLLSRDHEVVLVCGVRDESEKEKTNTVTRRFCSALYMAQMPIAQYASNNCFDFTFMSWLQGAYNIVRTLCGRQPFSRFLFFPMMFSFSRRFSQLLREAIANEKPAVVHLHDIHASIHIGDIPLDIPAVYCAIDSVSRYFYTQARCAPRGALKTYYRFRYAGARAWERFAFPRYRRVVVMTQAEKEWIVSQAIEGAVEVITLGVDTAFFAPLAAAQEPHTVLFSGLMSYEPNIDAVVYFMRAILPLVRKMTPDVSFVIVGANPPPSIRALARNPRIIVTGYVEDLRPFIARAHVYIAPLRSGAGIKSKLLIAMSMAKAVVATTDALRGIEGLRDGEHLLIADTPAVFAQKIQLLFSDQRLARGLGARARAFVDTHYGWEHWYQQFSRLYETLAHGDKTRSVLP